MKTIKRLIFAAWMGLFITAITCTPVAVIAICRLMLGYAPQIQPAGAALITVTWWALIVWVAEDES